MARESEMRQLSVPALCPRYLALFRCDASRLRPSSRAPEAVLPLPQQQNTISWGGHDGRHASRAQTAAARTAIILRLGGPILLGGCSFRGRLESHRARLGQASIRPGAECPQGLCGSRLRARAGLVLDLDDERVDCRNRADPGTVHPVL